MFLAFLKTYGERKGVTIRVGMAGLGRVKELEKKNLASLANFMMTFGFAERSSHRIER